MNPSPINSNSGTVGNGLDRSATKTKAVYGCLFLLNKYEPVPNFHKCEPVPNYLTKNTG